MKIWYSGGILSHNRKVLIYNLSPGFVPNPESYYKLLSTAPIFSRYKSTGLSRRIAITVRFLSSLSFG
ncbi:TPA: hypothetical protein ACG0AX_003538, partial [Elizabethkingia anophelis]